MRELWESFWDRFTVFKVYFFSGWQYIGIINSIINLIILLIVADFNKYLPAFMPGSTVFYACIIMSLIVICTTIFGYVAYYKAGRRENNMNVRNSPELYDKLNRILERLDEIENRI